MATLLVVDDEQAICWAVSKMGNAAGHNVLTASSAEAALEIVRDTPPDVIVLDVRLPGMTGLAAISHFQAAVGDVPIIVMTAYGDLPTAVEAVERGAFEYLVKPFDLDQLRRAVARALERHTPPDIVPTLPLHGIVGATPVMQEAFKSIAMAARSHAGVMLRGESGTGKELFARALHRYSRRSSGPFVAVNVAALSPTLAESELFGHVRGAFTGADQSRAGLLVAADGGTLFLDEVAEIPLPTQVKLLRALDRGEVVPVGADQPVHVDFRVISATHQDLLQKVHRGEFRHDLYFRLCAFQIALPPLRDRRDDIAPLAAHFIHELCGEGQAVPILADAIEELKCRPWHGNVRELRNAIEHALIVSQRGPIRREHLPPASAAPRPADGEVDAAGDLAARVRAWALQAMRGSTGETAQLYDDLMQIIEPPLFEVALAEHGGQCAAAARALGMHRTTLRKKLDQYRIEGQ